MYYCIMRDAVCIIKSTKDLFLYGTVRWMYLGHMLQRGRFSCSGGRPGFIHRHSVSVSSSFPLALRYASRVYNGAQIFIHKWATGAASCACGSSCNFFIGVIMCNDIFLFCAVLWFVVVIIICEMTCVVVLWLWCSLIWNRRIFWTCPLGLKDRYKISNS